MKKLYILPLIAAGLLATGCSKENSFGLSDGEGQFLKSALAMDIDTDGFNQTRAEADLDDFNVLFTLEGHSEPTAKYRYGDMPEVVTLPAGTYTCTATYGENRQAAWESPYFLGKSSQFEVIAYEICSYVDPIECKLENIKVTVDFDASLRSVMSSDSYVEVKVGSSSSLNYGLAEADAEKAGYFMHSDEISLVAVFHGTVDGTETVETKSLKSISKGCHYKITFKLHQGGDGDGTGEISGSVTTDATVEIVPISVNVPAGEEPLLDDSERPQEGEGGGDDPSKPDDPVAEPPTIVAEAPVDLDIINDGRTLDNVVLHITSTADGGFTGFICEIDSDILTAEALGEFGLTSVLDLANTPDSLSASLSSIGLPTNVAGKSYVKFDISSFMSMLAELGDGQSNFILTVTDANGTTNKTLRIKF